MKVSVAFACLIITLAWVAGCKKESSDDDEPGVVAGRLSYGDTLLFLNRLREDKRVSVVSRPTGTTRYAAIPGGLSLDSITGRINVSKSESGIRYKVFAFDASGRALDSVKLVVSGIDYPDGIYDLNQTPLINDTVFPIYNARPGQLQPCSSDDDDDDRCEYDETDIDDDGDDDLAGVNQDKLLVDKKIGTIDLEASLEAGLFGSSTPANGSLRNLEMFYRLNDESGRAIQKINLRIYYYRTRASIPAILLNELNQRNSQLDNANARFLQSAEFQTYSKPKRPPLLIIVGGL